MPDVQVDAEDVDNREDAIVKVTAESLGGGEGIWYLGYGDSIEIADDAPSHFTVEAAPFEEDLDGE